MFLHFTADQDKIDTIYRIILSINQRSVYGAVAAICEEFESIVFNEIKAEVLLLNEDSMNHQILWQQNLERIESRSPEYRVSEFCKEAGFMRVVAV